MKITSRTTFGEIIRALKKGKLEYIDFLKHLEIRARGLGIYRNLYKQDVADQLYLKRKGLEICRNLYKKAA